MHVADDLDGRAQFDQCRLTEKDLPGGQAYGGDLGILQGRTLGHLAAVSSFEETGDHIVHVERTVEIVARGVGRPEGERAG